MPQKKVLYVGMRADYGNPARGISFEERNLLIELDNAPGTSNPEMARMVTRASRELQTIPGVGNVGAHLGRAITGDQVVGTKHFIPP